MIWDWNPGWCKRFMYFPKNVQTDCRAIQPPIQCVPSALSVGIKWLEHEADHSPPSSAEVKKEWSHTSTHISSWLV